MRTSTIIRNTLETKIKMSLNLDGNKIINVNTGVPFFDHMLTLFAFHAGFDLDLYCDGDLSVDDHHSVEDVGIVLGEAVKEALGDKLGINRYGMMYLPMDEALSRAVIDISNRPFLFYKATFERVSIGLLSLENVKEFFRAFTSEARVSLHIETLYGDNDHHKVESIFKGFGRALKEATRVISNDVSSTKGVL
ncbi:MAG: imidazoleglycerol-phosphate dehydratase HisB [Acholeplasmataceae bacterium]|nr:imidazoleglycerol-phosphate dehydratase HisB [Acholeplasmataceae bacterium]